jgi:nucleoside-diphosphate-sugar epimerase
MEKMAVTGGAGFIGSNLSEHLLGQGFSVVVIDNLSTGRKQNFAGWSEKAGSRFQFLQADINETERLRQAFSGVTYVFHLAAIPSVVRSIYGDDPNLPKKEDRRGRCLSPYALSKLVTEEYCRLFFQLYGLETVALRYFNVFGPRQDPHSDYAAVIPLFCTRLLASKPPVVYGDGEQTRDFTFITNVVDANWKAATCPNVAGEAFNIGCGTKTSLNQLIEKIGMILGSECKPTHEAARQGDVRHSVADISKAATMLGYAPAASLETGLRQVLDWYRNV